MSKMSKVLRVTTLVIATIVATVSVIVSFPPYDMLLCAISGCCIGLAGIEIIMDE